MLAPERPDLTCLTTRAVCVAQSKHQAGIDTVAAREAHPGLEALPASLRLRAQRVLLPHMRALTQLTGEGQRWNLSSANE